MKNTKLTEINLNNQEFTKVHNQINDIIRNIYPIMQDYIYQIINNEFNVDIDYNINLVINPRLKNFIGKIKFYNDTNDCYLEINKEQLEGVVLFSDFDELPQSYKDLEKRKEYALFDKIILNTIRHELTHWFCKRILRSNESNDGDETFEKQLALNNIISNFNSNQKVYSFIFNDIYNQEGTFIHKRHMIKSRKNRIFVQVTLIRTEICI